MFQVEWLQDAVDELAAIWMQADSIQRRAITESTNAVDRELQADPFRSSESREDERRVLFAYPIGVLFEVDPRERIVWLLHVWTFRRRAE